VRTVLLEAYNVVLPRGTGIATYIRNLTEAVKASGYLVDGLLHSFSTLDSDPTLPPCMRVSVSRFSKP
jgi:hypothetical protein